jgi:hypothetical protein
MQRIVRGDRLRAGWQVHIVSWAKYLREVEAFR